MPKAKLTHSGDHDQMAPRNRITSQLIPGMSPEEAAEYIANTNTLLAAGEAGPMLPYQAGYHDETIRRHAGSDKDTEYGSENTYVGAGRNFKRMDAVLEGGGPGHPGMIDQEGDVRLGGTVIKYGNYGDGPIDKKTGRNSLSTVSQDFDAMRSYERGATASRYAHFDRSIDK